MTSIPDRLTRFTLSVCADYQEHPRKQGNSTVDANSGRTCP